MYFEPVPSWQDTYFEPVSPLLNMYFQASQPATISVQPAVPGQHATTARPAAAVATLPVVWVVEVLVEVLVVEAVLVELPVVEVVLVQLLVVEDSHATA